MLKKRRLSLDSYERHRPLPPQRELRNASTSTTPQISFNDLPNEIILHIVEYVMALFDSEWHNYPDYYNSTAKSSRQFQRLRQYDRLRFISKRTISVLQRTLDQEVERLNRAGHSTLDVESFRGLPPAAKDHTLAVWAGKTTWHEVVRLYYKTTEENARQLSTSFRRTSVTRKYIKLSSDGLEDGLAVQLDMIAPRAGSWQPLGAYHATALGDSLSTPVDILCIDASADAWYAVATSLGMGLDTSLWNFSALRRLDLEWNSERNSFATSSVADFLDSLGSSLTVLNLTVPHTFPFVDGSRRRPGEVIKELTLPRLKSLSVDAGKHYSGDSREEHYRLKLEFLKHLVFTGYGATHWRLLLSSVIETFSLISGRIEKGQPFKKRFALARCDWLAMAKCRSLKNIVLQLNEKQWEVDEARTDFGNAVRSALLAMTKFCVAPVEQLVIADSPYLTPGDIYDFLTLRGAKSMQIKRLGLMSCSKIKKQHLLMVEEAFPNVKIICATGKTAALADPVEAMIRSFPSFEFSHLKDHHVVNSGFRFS